MFLKHRVLPACAGLSLALFMACSESGSEDTTTEDAGQSPPSFLTDTHLSNPNSRADSDGFAPDQSADDVGITGTNYDNPSYDGCACDLTRSKQDRWRESLFLVLAISLGLGLLRAGNKNPRDVR